MGCKFAHSHVPAHLAGVEGLCLEDLGPVGYDPEEDVYYPMDESKLDLAAIISKVGKEMAEIGAQSGAAPEVGGDGKGPGFQGPPPA